MIVFHISSIVKIITTNLINEVFNISKKNLFYYTYIVYTFKF